MKSLFFLILCAFLSTPTQARTNVTTFMPENNLNEFDGLVDNGMTEGLFDAIITQVENYYAPIVSHFGATLVINHLWTDDTVNAQAYQQGTTWYVDMFGGLARRPEVTPDGFAMVVCHEVGHHLGGFPFVQTWAANEGQSDYWALHACAKNLWGSQSTEIAQIDSYAKKLCDNSKQQNVELCYREMNAGYSLASLLATLGGTKAAFNTPDPTKVTKTKNEHPNAQCRLDTYVAGTLCNINQWNDYVIPKTEKESAQYLCITDVYSYMQARPKCWFKPSK